MDTPPLIVGDVVQVANAVHNRSHAPEQNPKPATAPRTKAGPVACDITCESWPASAKLNELNRWSIRLFLPEVCFAVICPLRVLAVSLLLGAVDLKVPASSGQLSVWLARDRTTPAP
jgi:hypothetical protein